MNFSNNAFTPLNMYVCMYAYVNICVCAAQCILSFSISSRDVCGGCSFFFCHCSRRRSLLSFFIFSPSFQLPKHQLLLLGLCGVVVIGGGVVVDDAVTATPDGLMHGWIMVGLFNCTIVKKNATATEEVGCHAMIKSVLTQSLTH